MLNSVVDVATRCCVAFSLTKHFDERRAARDLLSNLRQGDTLVFDRGYYSKDLLRAVVAKGMHAVFRLRRNAFRGCPRFFTSSIPEKLIFIEGFGMARIVKYRIEGRWYACLTTLPRETHPVDTIKATYGKRWRVEEHFKRLKSHLHLETSHSRSPAMFVQELEMRVLADTAATLYHNPLRNLVKPTVSYINVLERVVGAIVLRVQRITAIRWTFRHHFVKRLQFTSLAADVRMGS
jgi:hypothetical protein